MNRFISTIEIYYYYYYEISSIMIHDTQFLRIVSALVWTAYEHEVKLTQCSPLVCRRARPTHVQASSGQHFSSHLGDAMVNYYGRTSC